MQRCWIFCLLANNRMCSLVPVSYLLSVSSCLQVNTVLSMQFRLLYTNTLSTSDTRTISYHIKLWTRLTFQRNTLETNSVINFIYIRPRKSNKSPFAFHGLCPIMRRTHVHFRAMLGLSFRKVWRITEIGNHKWGPSLAAFKNVTLTWCF